MISIHFVFCFGFLFYFSCEILFEFLFRLINNNFVELIKLNKKNLVKNYLHYFYSCSDRKFVDK